MYKVKKAVRHSHVKDEHEGPTLSPVPSLEALREAMLWVSLSLCLCLCVCMYVCFFFSLSLCLSHTFLTGFHEAQAGLKPLCS